ncbi:MAG: VOC family protein [Paracoccaceae bacterium]|jgi:predicted enzyme related to lactoylglutathione lyase|nr:VOC family protein [Paracoccaceae bacterium]
MSAPATRPEGATLAITFLYFRDLGAAARFYEGVLGLPLAIDQGWSRIYRLAGGAHVGLVDEAKGAHRASETKAVQLCLRVPDVDAWHDWAAARGVAGLTPVRESAGLGIRVFTFEDPEGHQIEIQTPLRERA